MGFEEWLLQMGIDLAAFMELPPQVQDAYKKAHASFNQRNQRQEAETSWSTQVQRDQEMNPDAWSIENYTDPETGMLMAKKRRKNSGQLRQDQRQADFDSARDAQTLMAMFGPKFRGGWGR